MLVGDHRGCCRVSIYLINFLAVEHKKTVLVSVSDVVLGTLDSCLSEKFERMSLLRAEDVLLHLLLVLHEQLLLHLHALCVR